MSNGHRVKVFDFLMDHTWPGSNKWWTHSVGKIPWDKQHRADRWPTWPLFSNRPKVALDTERGARKQTGLGFPLLRGSYWMSCPANKNAWRSQDMVNDQ